MIHDTPLRWRLCAALVLACGWSAPASALTPAEVFAKVSPSVWHVRIYDRDGMRSGQGSAVVVDQNTIVTNCHVLYYASRIVLSQGKTKIDAKLRMWDTERDICELQAPHKSPSVVLADAKSLAVGQPAYAVGSPLGLEQSLSAGLISSLRKDDDERLASVQTTASISPGSSGGGLFDDKGRLIGLTTSIANDANSLAQNLNFAIPAAYWVQLPERHAAALKAVKDGKPDRKAKALEIPTPTIAFSPTVTMPPNPAKWTLQLKDRVPHLSDGNQFRFRKEFLALAYPRAFAISDNGASGMATGYASLLPELPGDAQERALQLCQREAGKPCVVYAIDDEVLYQPPPQATKP